MKLGKKEKLIAAFEAIDQNNLLKLSKLLPKLKNIDDLVDPIYGEKTTLLCRASRNDQVDVVELLLRHNADVNVPNQEGITPIQLASEKNNIEITKILLKHGCNLNFFGKGTALHTASIGGHEEIMKLFIDSVHIDKNQQDDHGNTSLHIAVFHGHINACRLLLESNVDVNIQNYEGNTALHLSCKRKQVSTVTNIQITELLLKYNAQTDIKNKRGSLPEHEAYDSKITRLFIEHRTMKDKVAHTGSLPQASPRLKRKDLVKKTQSAQMYTSKDQVESGNLNIPSIQVTSSTPNASPNTLRRTRSATAPIGWNNASSFHPNGSVASIDLKLSKALTASNEELARTSIEVKNDRLNQNGNFSKEKQVIIADKSANNALKTLNSEIEKAIREEENLQLQIERKENDISDLRSRLKSIKRSVKTKLRLKEKIEDDVSLQNNNETLFNKSIIYIRRPMRMVTGCFGHM